MVDSRGDDSILTVGFWAVDTEEMVVSPQYAVPVFQLGPWVDFTTVDTGSVEEINNRNQRMQLSMRGLALPLYDNNALISTQQIGTRKHWCWMLIVMCHSSFPNNESPVMQSPSCWNSCNIGQKLHIYTTKAPKTDKALLMLLAESQAIGAFRLNCVQEGEEITPCWITTGKVCARKWYIKQNKY